MTPLHDVARIRLDNALRLFDEFVAAAARQPDAATLRGLERRFAERLQIQPSYWSQIKGHSRQIGERLARQFEQLCRKPVGWMDQAHTGPAGVMAAAPVPGAGTAAAPGTDATNAPSQPQDDDERFIVGLVLSYYRRHPQRARTRLLDLLGEVLTPPPDTPAASAPKAAAAPRPPAPPGVVRGTPRPAPPPVDDHTLWLQAQARVAPLKPRLKSGR